MKDMTKAVTKTIESIKEFIESEDVVGVITSDWDEMTKSAGDFDDFDDFFENYIDAYIDAFCDDWFEKICEIILKGYWEHRIKK